MRNLLTKTAIAITEKGEAMSEYIVRETAYPGAVKQEVVGEIVRCWDCKHRWPDLDEGKMICLLERSRRADDDEWFCADGKRRNE